MTGELKYIQDIKLPGMVHGRVVRPPNYHSKLVSVDLKTVRNSDGVLEVICDGSFLAVIADEEYRAVKAVNRLRSSAQWKSEAELDTTDIYHQLVVKST